MPISGSISLQIVEIHPSGNFEAIWDRNTHFLPLFRPFLGQNQSFLTFLTIFGFLEGSGPLKRQKWVWGSPSSGGMSQNIYSKSPEAIGGRERHTWPPGGSLHHIWSWSSGIKKQISVFLYQSSSSICGEATPREAMCVFPDLLWPRGTSNIYFETFPHY